MSSTQYIQFIGTQRSGTNLLRLMLNQLPQITAPHPPHIYKVLQPALSSYGNLDAPGNFQQLVNDVCELVNRNPVPWLKGAPTPASVVACAPNRTLAGALIGLYTAYAQGQNASFAACKSMANFDYYHQLEATGTQPRYLHLVRDGRDVVSSFQRAIVGPKHPYVLGKKWAREQEACLQLMNSVPAERVYQVRYENLIANPETVLPGLCAWLNVPYTDAMLRYYESEASQVAATSGRMWQNLARPVLSQNTGNFRRQLSADDLLLVEAAAGETLDKLGYACITSPEKRPAVTNDMEAWFNVMDETLRQEAQQAAPAADQQKRARYNEWVQYLQHQRVTENE